MVIIGKDITIEYQGVREKMVFECQQCGECCHHMGQVHTICETRSDVEFLVNNQYTGEKTLVTVEQDKWDIFFDESIFLNEPDACPFLRYRKTENKAYCTVHLTRPENLQGLWVLAAANPEFPRDKVWQDYVQTCVLF